MRKLFKELFRLILLIIAPIILLGAVLLYVVFDKFVDAGQPTYRQVELVPPDGNSKLYIKIENWGVTGSSQLTLITTEKNNGEFQPDSTSQIIFKGLEPFWYKQSNDTLILCVREKTIVPKGFNSSWIIIQKEIDTREISDLIGNYEYKGI